MLITLSRGEPAGPAMHTESGILNLPGHGGWSGDASDPKDGILKTLRDADPQSKQLPENQ